MITPDLLIDALRSGKRLSRSRIRRGAAIGGLAAAAIAGVGLMIIGAVPGVEFMSEDAPARAIMRWWPDSVWLRYTLALLIFVVLVAGFRVATWLIDRAPLEQQAGGATVNERIEQVARSLHVAAALVDEMKAELQTRADALETLRIQNAEYESLAAVRKKDAENVSRFIEAVIGAAHSRLIRSTRRDQLMFFLAGVGTAIAMQAVAVWLG